LNETGARALATHFGRVLEHDPEKWQPVFRKDHGPSKCRSANRFNLKRLRSGHLGRVSGTAESSPHRYTDEKKIVEEFSVQQELELAISAQPATSQSHEAANCGGLHGHSAGCSAAENISASLNHSAAISR
jgi:hypothetical protein